MIQAKERLGFGLTVGLTIGLFGGTFDPVHQGHLDLARHVLRRCQLDHLLFIPALLPPHKRRTAASFAHRVAMIHAALADCPDINDRVYCSRIEEHLSLPSYTINTVQALINKAGANRYALVIGSDTLLDLPHWYRINQLLDLVNLIVVRRDGIDEAVVNQALAALGPAFVRDQNQQRWFGLSGQGADYLSDIELPISSSTIREELAQGLAPSMLPPAVLHAIKQHQLYGQSTDRRPPDALPC